ncbi:MAG TPA: 4Fe-4S dicluster domain-containing protein, partial [Desulfobacteraceae bacterium]|nr:4Fe-4S dicluster domain-containing protein [Desulfobacteraceae bacterium]
MSFSILLYISLSIFVLGLIYKISTWFSQKIGISVKDITTSQRVFACIKGILGVVLSRRIMVLIRVFIVDVLFQYRILKEDFLRWLAHMLIYGGFMLLLLMHALEKIITVNLFSDYYSTINPFFFLRDLFGLMVIAGICIALYRRFILKVPRLRTNGMDIYAIIILCVIMVSGIFLEGAKIISYSEYQNMVEDYSDSSDEEDLKALESLWVKEFGVVSPRVKGPFDEEIIERGRELHEMSCAACHSSPKWAFTGFAAGKLLKPGAYMLDNAGGVNFLWYLHILACFVGLAYLPFSKMLHIIASPISLLANSVMDSKSASANVATRQIMELDACTHCGTCSLYCSAMMAYEAFGNEFILPSEKMNALKKMVRGKDLNRKELKAVEDGVFLCTNCDRCTVVCPSGISLRELWIGAREELLQKGEPEPLMLSPFSFVRGLNRKQITELDYLKPVEDAKRVVAGEFDLLIDPANPIRFNGGESKRQEQTAGDTTFSYCFG